MSHLDKDTDHVIYNIEKSIVEIIIVEMLWYLKDFEGQNYEIAMRVFMLDTHTWNYFVIIKTPRVYQLAIKYIGIGISFRQTALALQATKEVAMVSKLGEMNDLKIATFVRV